MSVSFSDKFCASCGNGLIRSAVVCPRCGSPVGGAGFVQTVKAKSKTTAVLLAVFLSLWSWLYTFSNNKVKFFIALPFELLRLYFVFASIALTISQTMGIADNSLSILLGNVIQVVLGFPIWLWAVIDNARRPKGYYENYS